MPKLTSDAVRKAVKANNMSNIYYVYGADIAEIDKLTKFLISTFVRKGDEDFSLSIFDGSDLNFNDLYEALERAPFFAPYNCVLVKDLNADALGAGIFPELYKKLEILGSSTAVIISITGFDVLFGKKFPVKNNKKLIDFCEKNGVLCECRQKTAAEHADYIIKKCRKSDCLISKRDAQYLAELCLCESSVIENEVDKLIAFADGKEITSQMICALTPRVFSADAFSFARAVGTFDSKKAFMLLRDVFDSNTDEISVCATLISAFVDLYRAKCAVMCSKTAEAVADDFDMNNRVFAVRNNMRDCRSMSLSHLRKCLKILQRTDLELKSTSADKRMLVEKAVTEMLMVRND